MVEKTEARNIGLNVKPPAEICQDTNCPFHGNLPVRGQMITGVVSSDKMQGSILVQREYRHLVPKYERYERRKSRVVAYNPPCLKARVGDEVIIAECRPLSKTKKFVVVAVPKRKVEQVEFKVAEIEQEAVKKARSETKAEPSEKTKEAPEKKEQPKKE